jgi:hypothetical protein
VFGHALAYHPSMNRCACAVSAALLTLCGCDTNDVTPAPAIVCPDEVPLPPPTDAGAPTGVGTSAFAMRNIRFGDTDDAGYPSFEAWRSLGFDIDGLATTSTSTNVCELFAGAARANQVDGVGGIDNSFGENVVPIILAALGSDATAVFDQSLEKGQASTFILIDALGADSNAIPLATRMFVGAPPSMAPQWNGTDVFPIDSTSFDDAGTAALAFAHSYVNDGVFVAEPPSGLGSIWIGTKDGIAYRLAITHLQFEMRIASDASGASGGVLSGILPTEALVALAWSVGGRISKSLCAAAAFASFAMLFEQASDILVDGTQDPTKPCDGISVGLGFSASRVQLGATTTVPPAPDPCVDP